MRLDFTRLITIFLGFVVAQYLIQTFLIMVGFRGVALMIAYNFLLSFVAVLIYYPPEYRKGAFKNPEFYRTVSIFFLIFLLLSLIGF